MNFSSLHRSLVHYQRSGIINCCNLPLPVSFRQVWAKLCFRKRAIKVLLSNERPIIALGRSRGRFRSLKADCTDFTRSDSESIIQQQFGEYHGYDGCYSIYFDSRTIVRLPGLL